MLRGAEPRKVLQTVVEKNVAAVMSYLSRGRWHVAKVELVDVGAGRFKVALWPRQRPHPVNVQLGQPVGMSIKYNYGKYVFDSSVAALEPARQAHSGGVVVLTIPERIEIVQRRSYFRVNVPDTLMVNAIMWVGSQVLGTEDDSEQKPPDAQSRQGRLADISAGGAQVVVDASCAKDFKRGQLIRLRFTPLPYDRPLMFDALIRNMLPTADGSAACLGLQIVGLEASPEGRSVLQRLCSVVERYYQMSQSGPREQEVEGARAIARLN